MQSSKFLNLYEIAYSNLACKGKTIGKSIRFSSQAEREDYALLMLLYMAIMKKERHIKTDLYQAFEELKIYLEDANAWAEPGTHYLFLSQEDVPYSKGQIKLKNNALQFLSCSVLLICRVNIDKKFTYEGKGKRVVVTATRRISSLGSKDKEEFV